MTAPQRSLRIAHVQPQSLDIYGLKDEELGHRVRYSLTNLAEAQRRLGHEPVIHMLTSERRSKRIAIRSVEARFYPCIEPPRRFGLHRRFARQLSISLIRGLSADRPDIIHFSGVRQFHLMYGAIALAAARKHIPLVAREDGARPASRLVRRAQLVGLRRTSAVLAGNEEGLAEFLGAGYPRERIHMMPNGFDPSIFFPAAPRPPESGDSVRLLAVSRLSAEKDPLTLVRAVEHLVSRGQRVAVTIAGDGPLRHEVERRLADSRIEFRVEGHVPQERVAELCREAHVLCLSSLGEGSSQVVVEAMACGLPVIATDVAGIRELVRGAGELVEPGDALAFAFAVERLAVEAEAWLALRTAGLERSETWTWDAIARQLDPIYAAALESPLPTHSA